jgi:hypothetical protein
MHHLDKYLEELNQRLPTECSEQELSSLLPAVFGSKSNIARRRNLGLMPPYLQKSQRRFIYLRSDIIDFVRDMYKQNPSNLSATGEGS